MGQSQIEDRPLKTCLPSGLFYITEQVMRLVRMTWLLFSCKQAALILILLVIKFVVKCRRMIVL